MKRPITNNINIVLGFYPADPGFKLSLKYPE
jgi:hypothetical protein